MANNYCEDTFGEDLYKRAIAKYGNVYKAIFAIMPEDIIREFLELDYLIGKSKLNRDFKAYIVKD